MSSSSHDPIAEATRRFRPVLQQAQRLGCQLAERVEDQFGPELAGIKQRGDRLLQQLAGGSQRLRERVCADEVKVPRVVKDVLSQADSLLGQLAQQVAAAVRQAPASHGRRGASGEAAGAPGSSQEARSTDGSGSSRRRRSRGGRRGPRATSPATGPVAAHDGAVASALPHTAASGSAPTPEASSPAQASSTIAGERHSQPPVGAHSQRTSAEETVPAAVEKRQDD